MEEPEEVQAWVFIATEVTTSQLRTGLMFPADDAADAYFRAHQPS